MAFESKVSPGEIIQNPQEADTDIRCGFLLNNTVFTELVLCEVEKPHDSNTVFDAVRRFKVNTGRTPKIKHVSGKDMIELEIIEADG